MLGKATSCASRVVNKMRQTGSAVRLGCVEPRPIVPEMTRVILAVTRLAASDGLSNEFGRQPVRELIKNEIAKSRDHGCGRSIPEDENGMSRRRALRVSLNGLWRIDCEGARGACDVIAEASAAREVDKARPWKIRWIGIGVRFGEDRLVLVAEPLDDDTVAKGLPVLQVKAYVPCAAQRRVGHV